jgi:Peptidase family S41/N-terminal domain of Peptidase_S41 in eukaryotic IRBP
MSEKIYAWLLRLYPSRFRQDYGADVLQLFRDRSRDERGFFPRLRLWLDLLADLARTLPRQYFDVQPELASYSAHLRPAGAPAFYVLANQSLGPGALLFGTVLAIAALLTFAVLLNHGVKHVPLARFIRPTKSSAATRSSSFGSPAPPTANHPREATNRTESASLPGNAATPSQPDDAASNSGSKMISLAESLRTLKERALEPGSVSGSTPKYAKLDAAERRRVVDRAAGTLERYYVDRDQARKMAAALRAHEKNGDDEAATNGPALAALLTRQMRRVSSDRHLTLEYSEPPLPPHPSEPTVEDFARYREALRQHHCSFEKVEIMPQRIGYLKLNSFPDLSVCQTTASAAMARLNPADAIIFDLRDNRGGSPAMVSFLASYLFDHPEYLYNPRENTTEQSWTHSPVQGNRLADKPVFVLTSSRTFSAAEQFCYDLQMLKRATLVGETTGGGAHAGVWHRIDDHFGMGIPETTAINPYAKTDWAEIGVEPDVKVPAEDALLTAVKLAQGRLQKE